MQYQHNQPKNHLLESYENPRPPASFLEPLKSSTHLCTPGQVQQSFTSTLCLPLSLTERSSQRFLGNQKRSNSATHATSSTQHAHQWTNYSTYHNNLLEHLFTGIYQGVWRWPRLMTIWGMHTEFAYVRVDTFYSKITSSPNLILGRGTTLLVYGNAKAMLSLNRSHSFGGSMHSRVCYHRITERKRLPKLIGWKCMNEGELLQLEHRQPSEKQWRHVRWGWAGDSRPLPATVSVNQCYLLGPQTQV